MTAPSPPAEAWPPLSCAEGRDTLATLHRWTQVVGKIRLALAAPVNHWWHVTLQVTARGLSTSPMPYGGREVEMIFDFVGHQLRIECSDGACGSVKLEPKSVAAFYRETMTALGELGVHVHIWPMTSEIPDGGRLDQDETHASYDPDWAHSLWRALVLSSRVMGEFRGRYLGKSSPPHFFWGGFDLAVTRFSGRKAPPHPGSPMLPDWIQQEAYSHECSSAGFWPGGEGAEAAIFYAYAYPEPDGFKTAKVAPDAARYDADLGEFVLPYDAVRTSADPEATLMAFLQSSYEAAADNAAWDRQALER